MRLIQPPPLVAFGVLAATMQAQNYKVLANFDLNQGPSLPD